MRKKMMAVSGVFFCVTGAALGQILRSSKLGAEKKHQASGQSQLINIAPMTPKQLADSTQRVALDATAAAALDAGQYEAAEEDARQSLSHGIGAGISEELLASALYAQNRTQEALHAYKVIAGQGDVSPRNLLPYALLLLKTGHWAQAVVAYDKQLPYLADGDLMTVSSHFSPDTPQPRGLATAIHIALGLTYGASASWGRHSQGDKALAEFRQALVLEPDSALVYLYYGRQLKQMGRIAEAQVALSRAAKLGDGDVKAAATKYLW